MTNAIFKIYYNLGSIYFKEEFLEKVFEVLIRI
jgi:hypothetical protein